MDEPAAIPMLKSIRSLYATYIALECSAAFPMIGMSTRPINTSDQPSCAVTGLIAPTNNWLFQAVPIVATSNTNVISHGLGGVAGASTSWGSTLPVTAATSASSSGAGGGDETCFLRNSGLRRLERR